MSDQDAGVSTVSETSQGPGFLQNLLNLFFGPTEAFTAIVKRPVFWGALALQIAIGLGFTALWVKKVDLHAFMEARFDESPRTAEMPGAQKAAIIEQQMNVPGFNALSSGAALGDRVIDALGLSTKAARALAG